MAFCRITSNDSDTTIFQTREQAGYSPQLVAQPYAYIEALSQLMSDGIPPTLALIRKAVSSVVLSSLTLVENKANKPVRYTVFVIYCVSELHDCV